MKAERTFRICSHEWDEAMMAVAFARTWDMVERGCPKKGEATRFQLNTGTTATVVASATTRLASEGDEILEGVVGPCLKLSAPEIAANALIRVGVDESVRIMDIRCHWRKTEVRGQPAETTRRLEFVEVDALVPVSPDGEEG